MGTFPRLLAAPASLAQIDAKREREDRQAVLSYQRALKNLLVIDNPDPKTISSSNATVETRILEVLRQLSEVQFRLNYTPSVTPANRGRDQLAYTQTLLEVIKHASLFITKYQSHPPNGEDIPRAYFLRAKAYQQLDQDAQAITDYKELIDHFPRNHDGINAAFNLFDLLEKKKDYASALTYLKKIPLPPTDPSYPLLLEHLGFTYYFLNDIPRAIYYLKLKVQLPAKAGEDPKVHQEELEKTLSNVALFYFAGVKSNLPNYTQANLVPFIRSFGHDLPLGKLLAYWGALLEAKGAEGDMQRFKDAALRQHLDVNDLLGVLAIMLEHDIARNNYASLDYTAQQIHQLMEQPASWSVGKIDAHHPMCLNFEKKVNTILSTIEARLAKNPPPGPTTTALTATLIHLYSGLLKMLNDRGDGVSALKMRLNLAQALLLRNDYANALAQYRWLAEGSSAVHPPQSLVNLAKLKVVTTQLAQFQADKKFPSVLKAAVIPATDAAVDPEITRWIIAIDELASLPANPAAPISGAEIDGIHFQANRLLYARGQITLALRRLEARIVANPASPNTLAAASLVLDTYIASENWPKVIDFGGGFLKTAANLPEIPVPISSSTTTAAPSTPPVSLAHFKHQVQLAMSSAQFKLIEAQYRRKEYPVVLTRVAELLGHPTEMSEPTYIALLKLGAHAALDSGSKLVAAQYLEQLEKTSAGPELFALTRLNQASIAEENYDFAKAAKAYLDFFGTPKTLQAVAPEQLGSVRSNALLYAWLASVPGSATPLRAALSSPRLCETKESDPCALYASYEDLLYMHANLKIDRKRALHEALVHAHPALEACVSLSHPTLLSPVQILHELDQVSGGLSAEATAVKFQIVAEFTPLLDKAVTHINTELRRTHPFVLDKAKIDARVTQIEAVEKVLKRISELPFTAIRVIAFNRLAHLYSDFAQEIASLPPAGPLSADEQKAFDNTLAELKAPFAKKGDLFKAQAISLAQENGVEDWVYASLDPQPDQNDSRLTRSLGIENLKFASPLADPALWDQFGAPPAWSAAMNQAVTRKHWGQMIHLIEDAISKKYFAEPLQGLGRAISLVLIGAQAEAFQELRPERVDALPKPLKMKALAALTLGYSGVDNAAATLRYGNLFPNSNSPDCADCSAVRDAMTSANASLKATPKDGDGKSAEPVP